MGANHWSDTDGLPVLTEKEQAKEFLCHVKTTQMTGSQAEECAINKCLKHFKVKEKPQEGKHQIFNNKCKRDGWSERTGYTLVYVGKPGDNHRMGASVKGEKTHEDALRYVLEMGLPTENKYKVFDFYDDGTNGKDK